MGPKGSAKFRKSLELATETQQGMQYPRGCSVWCQQDRLFLIAQNEETLL